MSDSTTRSEYDPAIVTAATLLMSLSTSPQAQNPQASSRAASQHQSSVQSIFNPRGNSDLNQVSLPSHPSLDLSIPPQLPRERILLERLRQVYDYYVEKSERYPDQEQMSHASARTSIANDLAWATCYVEYNPSGQGTLDVQRRTQALTLAQQHLGLAEGRLREALAHLPGDNDESQMTIRPQMTFGLTSVQEPLVTMGNDTHAQRTVGSFRASRHRPSPSLQFLQWSQQGPALQAILSGNASDGQSKAKKAIDDMTNSMVKIIESTPTNLTEGAPRNTPWIDDTSILDTLKQCVNSCRGVVMECHKYRIQLRRGMKRAFIHLLSYADKAALTEQKTWKAKFVGPLTKGELLAGLKTCREKCKD